MKSDKRPIIIVKKKGHGHAGHHGGAWKVAYADFVTAMMAFFMVMWILGMDPNVKDSIEGYFANPIGYKKGYSAGKSPLSSGNSPGNVQTTPIKLVARRQEAEALQGTGDRIKSRLEEAGLKAIGEQIEIVRTNSGLRIELAEGTSGREFFEVASSNMTSGMKKTLEIIAQELGGLRNPVIIEGHTDAAQYAGDYSNWELSADRANAARRVMQAAGLDGARVVEVRGMADRELRNPADPLDPKNRRITILLPFMTGDPNTPTVTANPEAAKAAAPTARPSGT
ncbi:MAG: Motility protein N-terminal domain protein [Gemmatimonadetes bacterium]|nr:Motility protein N-terminal domain protein [Gemmatimonadota bacterium]